MVLFNLHRTRRLRQMVPATMLGVSVATLIFWSLSPARDIESIHQPPPTSITSGVGAAIPALGQPEANDHQRDSGLIYDDSGLLKGWDAEVDIQVDRFPEGRRGQAVQQFHQQHPIELLIASGLKRWNKLLARQSHTLGQSVAEYRRRYGRPPPKGFDKWFAFCQMNGVKIVDDINRDIEPYFALSPELFTQRVKSLEDTTFSYKILLSPHGPSEISGERGASSRPQSLFSLLEPIAQYLPTDVLFYGSDHDMGSWLLGDDQRKAALQAIAARRYLTEDELTALERRSGRGAVEGLVSACPDDSPAWAMRVAEKLGNHNEPENSKASLVYDPRPGYDFCYTPKNLLLHGALSFDFARETTLRPIFQLSKFSRNPEFLTTPLQAFENITSAAAKQKTKTWDEKTLPRLFWRGSSTGDSYSKKKNGDWRRSHRPRLHLLAQYGNGTAKVFVERHNQWVTEMWSRQRLNEAYFDIGLTGRPHQCKVEDGTCAEMESEIVFKDRISPEQSNKYKYVLDVDGNGWSSRFHRLLVSGSVVLKTTIYPEWNSDWLIPWVHYVPVQIDYSDLYNIMSFFQGPPDSLGSGRDDLARDIAQRARSFGIEHWRWEDMQAYMFRLLLEYARLMADDRDTWIYTP